MKELAFVAVLLLIGVDAFAQGCIGVCSECEACNRWVKTGGTGAGFAGSCSNLVNRYPKQWPEMKETICKQLIDSDRGLCPEYKPVCSDADECNFFETVVQSKRRELEKLQEELDELRKQSLAEWDEIAIRSSDLRINGQYLKSAQAAYEEERSNRTDVPAPNAQTLKDIELLRSYGKETIFLFDPPSIFDFELPFFRPLESVREYAGIHSLTALDQLLDYVGQYQINYPNLQKLILEARLTESFITNAEARIKKAKGAVSQAEDDRAECQEGQ